MAFLTLPLLWKYRTILSNIQDTERSSSLANAWRYLWFLGVVLNAIYSDFTGKIYDPLNGSKDLKDGIVKFIGDPNLRINEDNLRILRYLRL